MSWDQFLDLTPKELYDGLKQKTKYHADSIESGIRLICETIRVQTFLLYNIQLPRGKKVRDEKKLIRFYWERKPRKPQTIEQMKVMMKAIAKGFNKKKHGKKNRRSRS